MMFDPESGAYFPTVFMNEFWLLRNYLVPVNHSLPAVNLTLTVAPLSMWRGGGSYTLHPAHSILHLRALPNQLLLFVLFLRLYLLLLLALILLTLKTVCLPTEYPPCLGRDR